MQRCPMDKWFPSHVRKSIARHVGQQPFSDGSIAVGYPAPCGILIADTMVHLQDWHQTHGRIPSVPSTSLSETSRKYSL